jgi:hypothetical protein
MFRLFLTTVSLSLFSICQAQYNWKLEKKSNDISVYLSDIAGFDFKAVKVECTLTGTFAKLKSLLTNVGHFPDWIYNCNSATVLRQYAPHDFVYQSITHMPWPVTNREAIIHLRINIDSVQKVMTISGMAEPDLQPLDDDYVRIRHYKANWYVTMPTAQSIKIVYIVEVDPAGTIPAWMANSMAEKGPYETFTKIAEELKK